ncbi:MAG: ornithine carbamoyltransferase [Ignavibacteriales bacterium CG07_land_8_20_14_0_80_59_12]|nr:MAG: ornithine carbamoyltransferase [Ignavibacteriales bacterium CG07_land_8_20_14_0_80_59_12]
MHTKDFISIHDLTLDEFHHLFDLGRDLKAHKEVYASALKGKTLAMIFEKQSLRTRVTFEVGIQQLGGFAVYLAPSDISLGKRESVQDVAKNLSRWVDGIMIRTFGHDICTGLAEHATIPVINGLTDLLHPCQAMADYFTMMEHRGTLKGLNVTYVGDGNNVAHSLMFGGAKAGANVAICCPKGYEPNPEIFRLATEDARETGATIRVLHDPKEAVRSADVIYTDVWASMGQEAEAEARKEIFKPYQVNAALMKLAKPDAIFMHCLPAHRGDEVTDDVIDSTQSVVYDEAENRLHMQKAVMVDLMKARG